MSNSIKNKPTHKKSSRRKSRQMASDTDEPCNSTSSNDAGNISGTSKSRKVGNKPHGKHEGKGKSSAKRSVNNPSDNSEYRQGKKKDKDRRDSRKRLKEKCLKHRNLVTSSYRNRRLSSEEREKFDALLGIRNKYADHMPTSDIKLRRFVGKRVIGEMDSLSQRAALDHRLSIYHGTFLDDEFMINERSGTAAPMRFMHKVQSAIRQYTSLNAFGFIENQALTNYPKGDNGKSLSIHAHAIIWGYDDGDPEQLVDHAKGFQTALTNQPIFIQKIGLTEGDFTTVGRYLAKPPTEGKVVDYTKLEEGKACLRSITDGMKKYHHLRLFEYGAKIPMEHTMFGVGEGVPVRQRIVNQMKAYQKKRSGSEMQIGKHVYDLFEGFLDNNKKLKNYHPMQVIYKRGQK